MFVGGLQRSGTTSVSNLLGSLDYTSKLTLTQAQMARNRPWEMQNMTMEYFYDVVSEGDVEGKFVQDVYPYKYILDIVGRSSVEDPGGGSIADIVRQQVLSDADVSDQNAGQRLFNEWSPYWNVSKEVLVEKTPENIIMAPLLRHMFEDQLNEHAYFLFTLRHPLAWALAIEKWLGGSLKRLHELQHRFLLWMEVMKVAQQFIVDDTRGRSAFVMIENFTAVYAREVVQPLLPGGVGPNARRFFEDKEFNLRVMQENILRHSVQYVGCWLKGKSYDSCRMRCTTLSERYAKSPHLYGQQPRANLAQENQATLSALADQHEEVVNTFGYSLRSALRLIEEPGHWNRQLNRFNVDDMSVAELKSFLFAPPPAAEKPERSDFDRLSDFYALRARPLRQGAVIFAPKLNTITGSGKALGGMLQRQDSLIRSVQASADHTGLIYFDWKPQRSSTLPHCTKGPATYAGADARTQYIAWREYIQQHHIEVTTAILFLTTPTMAMHYFAKVVCLVDRCARANSTNAFMCNCATDEHVQLV